MFVSDVPFNQLKIGDKVISCTGKPGVIAALYPVGSKDPYGYNWDDWDGGILMLWSGLTFSLAGYSDLQVGYDERNLS